MFYLLLITTNNRGYMDTKYMHVYLNLQKLIKRTDKNILQKYIYS